jgi:hypothetical protein
MENERRSEEKRKEPRPFVSRLAESTIYKYGRDNVSTYSNKFPRRLRAIRAFYIQTPSPLSSRIFFLACSA